jgi:hypothetical protein
MHATMESTPMSATLPAYEGSAQADALGAIEIGAGYVSCVPGAHYW